jgi:hypothetical protein
MNADMKNRLWSTYQLLTNMEEEGLRQAARRRVLIDFATSPPTYRYVDVPPQDYEARLAELREQRDHARKEIEQW